MRNPDQGSESLLTSELREEAKRLLREITGTPDYKRFRYLGERYYSGEATQEERAEYEAETAWMKNLPNGLVPDDHPLSMGGFPSKKKRSGSKENTPGDAGAAAP
jgi:hypothetical protein